MADSLYEVLAPQLSSTNGSLYVDKNPIASRYLTRLTTLPLSALSTTEQQSLNQISHSNDLSLQALASRSHKSTVSSVRHLATLTPALPAVTASVSSLRDAIPQLDQKAVQFSTTYSKSRETNATLDRRKSAMLLSRQVDKISEILELPSLLSTAIASAGSSSNMAGTNYSQALDLFAHIKRLQTLYPNSALIASMLFEAEMAMREMTTNLITSLRGQNIRLAAAIRTIGFLRRVIPDLGDSKPNQTPLATGGSSSSSSSAEGLFGSLFLTARLANLLSMLEALSPLRELADQETARRLAQPHSADRKPSIGVGYVNQGQQTEKYLKRYIEIFREHSFATISTHRNIFPSPEEPIASATQPPTALATFPLHIVEILMETLRTYLPNVTEVQGRESLLTQVLYAAGSLGRLGADFSMMLALLEDEGDETWEKGEDGDPSQSGETHDVPPEKEAPEWAQAIEKHRIQSARLEALAAGQEQRRGSSEVTV